MKYLLLILFLYIPEVVFSQKPEKEFAVEMFKNPIQNGKLLEGHFIYKEIDQYKKSKSNDKIFLENGYAQHYLSNSIKWDSIRENVKVNRISIIYTKYPFMNSDWITNYYILLANRLEELFLVDSSLNVNSIDWYLVAQTNCNTSKSAKDLLHGIEIQFTYNNFSEDEKIIIPDNYDVNKNSDVYRSYERERSVERYQEFSVEESKRYKTKEKKKQMKEPDCPDFSKKKFRLFRKRK